MIQHQPNYQAKRLKAQFARQAISDTWFGPRLIHPDLRTNCHKRFSTLQERRWNLAHQPELQAYRTAIRGRRYHKSLPNSNWDFYPSVLDTMTSWKHNSKRRKQWYRE
ncbi:hypothetical protein [Ferrimonas marina]|uniref:Uncharacterized protein n=1 Tax=Ferrimonas marina TaxID=299255 RepID=A0A1M5TYR4_9GAMM|nr:hypothetical protein [Ferrimonas marina]SHH55834.1 hypothetical protein SAMN02745129_2332 [Ferrimonas marina]